MKSARLLLIEEDYSLRRLIEDHLRHLGRFDVEVADDGEVGLERAVLGQFDVILVSLQLSEIPPKRVVEALAAVRPEPTIVAIARPERLQALGEDRLDTLADVLLLPLRRPTLGDVVLRALHRHHERLCRTIVRPGAARSRSAEVMPKRRKSSHRPVRLGHYELSELLGSGLKGTVYRGVDQRNSEAVAVRAIPRSMVERLGSGPRWFERFTREASMAAAVHHPRVISVLDHGIEEDQRCLFVVSELARGVRLSERLEQGPLEPAAGLQMGLQLAGALAAVHEGGFTHRLVRPTNVFVDDNGDVTLADVGIAGMLAWDLMPLEDRLTDPPWSAPEQLKLGRVDDRGDQFSLGLVLYASLTGKYPYAGDSATAKVRSITTAAPRLLLDEGYPEGEAVLALIGRMLAREPEERFQSDDEMLTAVREVAEALA